MYLDIVCSTYVMYDILYLLTYLSMYLKVCNTYVNRRYKR